MRLGGLFFAAQAARFGAAVIRAFSDAPRTQAIDRIAANMDKRFDGVTSRVSQTESIEVILEHSGCHVFFLVHDPNAQFELSVADKSTGSIYSIAETFETSSVGGAVVGIENADAGLYLSQVTSKRKTGRFTLCVKYLSPDAIDALTSMGHRLSIGDGWTIPVSITVTDLNGDHAGSFDADAVLRRLQSQPYYHIEVHSDVVKREFTSGDNRTNLSESDFENLRRGQLIEMRARGKKWCVAPK